MPRSFIHAVDDFYPEPKAIRRKALSLSFTEPENLTGWRTHAYHVPGIRGLIERKFRVKIAYWERDRSDIGACNGVFLSAYSRGNRAETVGVHYDDPPSWVMLLVYLTPDATYDAGTSLWQHRATGLIAKPTTEDARKLGTSRTELDAMLEKDSKRRDRWIEIDRVGNVFNRAVMFPGGLLHSASRHFGNNLRNGRLYQSFHFPIRFTR